jgi:transcriptional regulator with XRE-family HTH domain
MDTTKRLLGARIKELRKLRGLSQEKLAEIINIDPKHLSRIEVGRSFPSMDTLEGIAKALKVELKEFFAFEHHIKDSKELIGNINRLFKETGEDKLRLILKIVRAIVY